MCLVLGSGATDATDAKVKSSKLNFFFFLFLLWLSLTHRLRGGAQRRGVVQETATGHWSLGLGFLALAFGRSFLYFVGNLYFSAFSTFCSCCRRFLYFPFTFISVLFYGMRKSYVCVCVCVCLCLCCMWVCSYCSCCFWERFLFIAFQIKLERCRKMKKKANYLLAINMRCD